MFGWKQAASRPPHIMFALNTHKSSPLKGFATSMAPWCYNSFVGIWKHNLKGEKNSADQKPDFTPQVPGSPQLHSVSLSPKTLLSSRKTTPLTCGGAGCRCRMQVWIIQWWQTLPSAFCLQNCLNSVRQIAQGVAYVSIASPWEIGQTDICLVSRRLRGDINVHVHTVSR